MVNHLAFGALPSEQGIQDIHAHQVLDMAVIPPQSFSITYNAPEFNQKAIGICTAADLVDMARQIWGIEFSSSFTYWGGKEIDGNLYEGSSNLSMLKHATTVGFLPIQYDPNGNDTSGTYQDFLNRKNTYTSAQIGLAGAYKLTGYALVPLDPIGFAMALVGSKYGLLTRMAVGDNFYRPSWKKSDLELLKSPNPVSGGHSIKVIGYDGLDTKQTRLMRNSWGGVGNPTTADGAIWSDDGMLKYEYDTQQPYVTEAYVVFADPITFKHKFNTPMFYGQTSGEVTALQRLLVQWGYLVMPQGASFGHYGDLTRQAVLAFQLKNNVSSVQELTALNGMRCGVKTIFTLNQIQGL